MTGHDDDLAAAGDDLRDAREVEDRLTWDEATRSARDTHRLWCAYGCAWCDTHRDFGTCSLCFQEVEFGDDGHCLECKHGTHNTVDYDEDFIHPEAA